MAEAPANPTSLSAGDFYVTGGTLRPDAPSYIERRADKELCEGLMSGEFCYVLTSRQMGKSSLMVRAVKRLREGGVAVAVLDLTAIGQNLTIEQWYDGLISRLGQQLSLEDDLLAFWQKHPEWGPLQRWTTALEQVILERLSSKVVIFVDEIDIVRSLPFSTDEFFAGIRECYNRRARESAFNRLAFGLLGVATPNDLIRDTRMTPFNIGRRVELNDFTYQEAEPLTRGLNADESAARELLQRVLYWTGGHPYLTQRLCRALAEALSCADVEPSSGLALPPLLPDTANVDRLAEKLFLSRQARDRDDNLIFVRERILRSEVDVPGLLSLYRQIHYGQAVVDDETNPLVSVLRLSGITRGVNGYLQVRNRIYGRVFDPAWVQTNMPQAEVRRQRKASRRGMLVGFAGAGVLLLGYIFLHPAILRYQEKRLANRIFAQVEANYQQVHNYRDTFDASIELGVGGVSVPIDGSGSIIFEKPDRVNLALKSSLHQPEIEIRAIRDGRKALVSAAVLNEYEAFDAPPPSCTAFDLPGPVAWQLGPVSILPLYRLLLGGPQAEPLLKDAHDVRFEIDTELKGQPVYVLHWQQDADSFLSAMGLTNSVQNPQSFLVVAWVNTTNDLVVQLRADLSDWAKEILGNRREFPITGLVITESHAAIDTTTPPPPQDFNVQPPDDARPVDHLQLPPPNFAILSAPRRHFLNLIPSRLPLASSNQVDLTDYYNGALNQAWHPGSPQNNLGVLPSGLLQLGGVVFDVRGVVQLAGLDLLRAGGRFPQQLSGIRVFQTCHQIHFLQAAGWRAHEGTRLGSYLVHYTDGRTQAVPIIYGEDVRDWNTETDPSHKLKRAVIAWSGVNADGRTVRLFKSTWVNPWPTAEIADLDYVSAMANSAPFLVAITLEP